MREVYAYRDVRRSGPRVGVDAVAWDEAGREALVVDLSADGLRIERPHVRPIMSERIQIELELPEIDEVAWIGGEICFDRRVHRVQSTGIRVVSAAARDLRRIRDFVFERARRLREDVAYDLAAASCYARG